MEQSRLKLRICRMFRASFGSCRTRNTSDVDEKALFASQPPHHQPLMTSPKPRPFPSICRPEPGRPDSTRNCIRVSGETLRRRPKVSKRRGFSGENGSTKPLSSSSGWWLSSDDDDETETLFSSRTLSSDSTESRRRRSRRRHLRRRNRQVGIEVSAGKVEDSFAAVVKRSSDPYGDFRTSMVEMIVEKQMFGAEDLENLLQCFLSLNSRQHHEIIVHVFTEIWEALLCNWS